MRLGPQGHHRREHDREEEGGRPFDPLPWIENQSLPGRQVVGIAIGDEGVVEAVAPKHVDLIDGKADQRGQPNDRSDLSQALSWSNGD
jgi:hypothetical protein